MAEFKLGRIRFIWKGEWVAGTTYVKDDVVRVNGKVFICVIGHVADTDFYVDAENVPARWNQISDGTKWRGDWVTGEVYYKNDIVKYGGQVYLCTVGHTSAATLALGLEADLDLGDSTLSKWDQFAESFDWKGDWTTSTRYKLNDIVKYGGNLYLCNLGHSSASTITQGLEGLGRVTPGIAEDLAKWDIYSEAFDWKTDWTTSYRYKINDVVKFGGTTYVCNEGHTSAATFTLGLEDDQGKWDYFNQGIEYLGDWDDYNVDYKINDVVKYGASLWICTAKHTSSQTTTFEDDEDSGYWARFVEGLEFESSWNSATIYQPGDVITYGGYAYIAKTNHSNIKPTTAVTGSQNWDLFTTGFKLQNDWDYTLDYKVGDVVRLNGYTYIAVVDVPNITATATATDVATKRITVGDTTGFVVGMSVRFGGTTFGNIQNNVTYYVNSVPSSTQFTVRVLENGSTPVDVQTSSGSMTVTVTAHPANPSYWSRLNSGIRWLGQWRDDYDYMLGDAVRYGPNSYICVNAHHSEGDDGSTLTVGTLVTRPDVDVTGTYWNVLSVGSEVNVLTTQGDIVYYGGAGPTRLPIGSDGQVLVVSNASAPQWKYWGLIDQLYYVDTAGTDSPAPTWGITLDKPWNTIQYACQQIEKGARNPQAAYLLEINRQFIQRETVEWIDYQRTNNISPFVSGFTYDKTKCERDVGYIIDALIKDVRQGGNANTRRATLEYINNAPNVYSLGQEQETVAALQYAINTVAIAAVLTNTPPAANYQTLNGITVGNRILQIQDISYTAEQDALDQLADLKDIVYVNVLAGTSTNIPVEVLPQRTILVKTGVFYETLPIVVPINTAVVGDELRSTNIRPAPSQIGVGDVAKSLDALTRLKAIVTTIIQGSTVTKTTTGSNPNTLTQSQTKPFATATQGTLAQGLVQNAYDYINYYVNSSGSAPSMSGTVAPVSAYDVYAAVRQLELNRSFIIAEIHAYIANAYPSYTYTLAACARDVSEYIDALKYDLIYTGNYATLTAAKLYVNGVTGSLLQNMFLVRNSTGLRNCTVQGLTGTLGAVNAYGTKRPTAGAYVSLDPGWGTGDTRAWITTRSCYVQNVTTFGTACVGLMIDGNLHGGGNKSVVANDFTQVLSDGIGVWCTNLARTELVSVFSYYGHIGYLAENGGKIRATNGNSSYGTFGCVSEGVDPTETAVTGTVNNRFEEAAIAKVITNNSAIQRVEFLNAGSDYTSATYTFNGAGINADTTGNEVRDNAVFEVRLTDPADNYGGADYISVENVAQTGSSTSITLAATDGNTSSAYVGMRIFLTSGTGQSQFGYINSYNSGTKVAQVYKESTGTAGWDHSVPGTTITAPDASTQYVIEPRLTFTAPTLTDTVTGTLPVTVGVNEVAYVQTRSSHSAVAATGGAGTLATFDVVRVGLVYTVTLNAGGTGYAVGNTLTIAGTSLNGTATTNNLTIKVTNVTSPAGVITGFTYTGYGRGGNYVAVPVSGSSGMYSRDAVTWTSATLPAAQAWSSVASGTISTTVYTVALPNTGSTTAAYSTNGGETWTTASLPQTGTYNAVAFGNGRFIGVRGDSATPVISTNGTTWANGANPLPNSVTTWTSITYGAGKFVAVATGTNGAGYSLDGITWVTATMPASTTWSSVTFGNNRFVAVNSTGTAAAYSINGTTWTTVSSPPGANRVSYGQGVFLGTRIDSAGTSIWTSPDGIVWSTRTVTSGRYAKPALGNTNWTPRWALISNTTGTTGRYVVAGATTQARCSITDGKITQIRIVEPGSGYASAPTMTITDPNNTVEAPHTVRTGRGALGNPTFNNRGTLWVTATSTVAGDGYADFYQPGGYVDVKDLYSVPVAGSNVVFSSLPNNYYKLVTVTNLAGTGPYTARLQISPALTISEAPAHEESFETRIRYSQCRLTGHDFLDIGTGNFTSTNYPGLPYTDPDQDSETVESGGGRVFFTSTDQDGNFRVGDLFTIEQATGTASLNASAFNLAGLQELQLGSVELGTGGATITEFSTDPFFTADSDTVIPTQRAIKAYIASQIGSGSSTLNVNTLTAGSVFVSGSTITTTTGFKITVNTKLEFTRGIDGYPVAMNLFLQG